MLLHPSRSVMRFVLGLAVVIVTATPLVAAAGGIVFLPGATRATVIKDGPSLDLLTWELPGGLLVADRTGPAGVTRLGAALPSTDREADWFLVRTSASHDQGADPKATLAPCGRVHFAGPAAYVIEVPRARLAEFLARGLDLQRIPLDAPPVDARAKGAAPSPLAAAQADTALKRVFVSSLSQSAFNQLIQEISGYALFYYNGQLRQVRTRYYNTAAKNLAGDYLADKLGGYGYTVAFDTFSVGGVICRNIVATKLGRSLPDENVIVGGHYDSISETQYRATNAPGAEDNGSGTSLVMEIARISANRQFDRSVQFVLFDSEEQGLNGSEHFVAETVAQGRQITGAIIADMVAWYQSTYGLHIEGQTAWEPLMSAMATNVTKYTPCVYVKDYYSWGSDHVPFQQAGIPAFLAIDYEYENYPSYHTRGDTWNQIQSTVGLGLQITKAAAATLADAAGLRPDLTGVPVAPPAPPRLAAWPNPFNPRVTIAFNLPAPSDGDVALYDLAGRRLTTLASGRLPAGEQRFSWDGRDSRGRLLPSGVYLCRLRTADGAASLKLNLAR